jgi:hypothetical protein
LGSPVTHKSDAYPSYADAPAELVIEEAITGPLEARLRAGRLPFALPGVVPHPNRSYTVSVLVDLDGDGQISRGDFVNMASYPVLTFGHPEDVRIRVRRVD